MLRGLILPWVMLAPATGLLTPAPASGAAYQLRPTDDRLEALVKAALSEDPIVESFEIVVTAFDGVVRLNGAVHSDEERAHAGSVAAEVEGVDQVENQISVSRTLVAPDKSDAQLRREILEEFAETYPEISIEVSVEGGLATLVGHVPSAKIRRALTKIAFRAGALLVRNRVKVEPVEET